MKGEIEGCTVRTTNLILVLFWNLKTPAVPRVLGSQRAPATLVTSFRIGLFQRVKLPIVRGSGSGEIIEHCESVMWFRRSVTKWLRAMVLVGACMVPSLETWCGLSNCNFSKNVTRSDIHLARPYQ
ncbi:hypothetical protein PM082_020632 [Marasmius tenuissimus]|nr:hypothetical protein PM082_020632 [Marasmius tenuissimus]